MRFSILPTLHIRDSATHRIEILVIMIGVHCTVMTCSTQIFIEFISFIYNYLVPIVTVLQIKYPYPGNVDYRRIYIIGLDLCRISIIQLRIIYIVTIYSYAIRIYYILLNAA